MAWIIVLSPLVALLYGDLTAVTGLIALDALGVLAPIRDAILEILTAFGFPIV